LVALKKEAHVVYFAHGVAGARGVQQLGVVRARDHQYRKVILRQRAPGPCAYIR